MARLALGVGALLAAYVVGGALATEYASSACARGYSPCLPVVGDLDCGQIPDSKKPIRVTGSDPYGLDRDRDGLGCEVSGEGGGRQSPWGLILRKGRKEATSVKVGDTLTVVGWSPAAFKGVSYQLCVSASIGQCFTSSGFILKGTAPQTFGTWKVRRGDGLRGIFKLFIMVKGKVRASDTVPIR